MNGKFQAYALRLAIILLFTICLAFALFFANGYNYDFVSNEFRKSGGIDVNFKDKQAQVFLDGKLLTGNLPFVISNILPGNYDLIIARPGFISWHKKIEVVANLVKKLDQIVLFPENPNNFSQLIWSENKNKANFFLKENYIFKSENGKLSFSKLSQAMGKNWEYQLNLPENNLVNIVIQDNRKVVLNFVSGKRYFLDLVDLTIKPINLAVNFLAADQKWLFYKNNLVAFFDEDLSRVIWAGEFGKKIEKIEFFNEDWQSNLLKIQFVGDNQWNIYAFKDNNLVEIVANVDIMPLFDAHDKLLVLSKGKELRLKKLDWVDLWKSNSSNPYDSTDSELLWQRFSEDFKLKDFWAETKSFLFDYQGKLMLADFDFTNVYQIFNGQKIVDLKMLKDGSIYYLEETIDEKENPQINLRVLDSSKF